MRELETLLPSNQNVELAKTQYKRLVEMESMILRRSHDNTNVGSLSISLSERRKTIAICQDTLSALKVAIDEE